MTIAPLRSSPPAQRSAPLMAAARAVATDETVVLQAYAAGSHPPQPAAVGGGDPLDTLVERIRPELAHAVDPLQLAASLEADGLTDRAARVEYGFDDVFVLAEEAFRRLEPGPPPPAAPPVEPSPWRSGRRDVAHGLLYLMPSALFPAVLAAVGRGPLMTGLVLSGGLGWAWSGGASWLAYRRLGAGDEAGAAWALRRSVALGLPAAALLGAVVAGVGGGWGSGTGPEAGVGPALVALCLAQMAYQLASMLLVFYRREGLLAATMAPAVLAGCGYVLLCGAGTAGWPGLGGADAGSGLPAQRHWAMPLAVGLGAVAVFTALLLGLRETSRVTGGRGALDPVGGESTGKVGAGVRAGVRTDLPGLAWATAYAAISATYLLHAQARYLVGRVDIAVAAVPLLAGMGVVEWRARRFTEQARTRLARVRYPGEFAGQVWQLLAGGVAVTTGVVAVLAVPLLAALGRTGRLGTAGVLMAAAHAVLAGAYFLSFLLAGQGRYPALCAAVLTAAVLHQAGGALLGADSDPVLDTGLFLASALLLQLLWAVLLARAAAEPWRYR